MAHLLQVGHGLDVDPALGHGDDQVGAAEAERAQQQHAGVDVAAALAQQVLAGDAQMHLPEVQGFGDVAGRQQPDLDAGHALEFGHVAARSAGHGQFQSAVAEPGLDLFLQAPLRGDGEDKGFAHDSPPAQARQGRTTHPTALTSAVPPSREGRLS